MAHGTLPERNRQGPQLGLGLEAVSANILAVYANILSGRAMCWTEDRIAGRMAGR